MPENPVEAGALLLTAPFVSPGIFREGAERLTEKGVPTKQVSLPWGRFTEFRKVNEPLIEAIVYDAGNPQNEGPLVVIGPGISSAAAGYAALKYSEVGGAVLVSPHKARFTNGANLVNSPSLPIADAEFADAWRQANASDRARITYLVPLDTDYHPQGADRVVFSYVPTEHPLLETDLTHLLTTDDGIQTLYDSVLKVSK